MKLVNIPNISSGKDKSTAYYSIEPSKIDYIREKQNDIRNECLSGLYDIIRKDTSTAHIVIVVRRMEEIHNKDGFARGHFRNPKEPSCMLR
nr:hypothetical protein [Tanacetum cinerariifolium]